jgi:hypothetical protein
LIEPGIQRLEETHSHFPDAATGKGEDKDAEQFRAKVHGPVGLVTSGDRAECAKRISKMLFHIATACSVPEQSILMVALSKYSAIVRNRSPSRTVHRTRNEPGSCM